GAKPDVLVFSKLDQGLERVFKCSSNQTVCSVGTYNQVARVSQTRDVGHVCVKCDSDAELGAAPLKDVQEGEPSDSGEVVSSNCDLATAMNYIDVVPTLAGSCYGLKGLSVVGFEIRESLIREYDSPAEGVVWPVAFAHLDIGAGIELLHQDRKVKPGGPPANDRYPHSVNRKRPVAPPAITEGSQTRSPPS